ncbi:hypothetical protein pEaSNUABM50_00053 [Erwinia phage pEa_SNUABM_50]|uniref:Uncharacterized protein n=3 Tax=Eneladusvirus BF TaxID=2560751 RepID=A0A7L8ZMV0_9CAUD|nr:hypothetical protein FDH34_gp055 [Serratia phage BF]QOI71538.1 hypothetical protein pEaSNUABM47_00054 [Erwinia phage pEa_SNUABM_47]QOI72077.1 hypothetical protein pEaSNUABM50_00053 [Erwinia phage pEa_SNUABM_50]QXO11750.1 hypothetical protein pEaSNUABM44_00054 [Erwinia phage pEa_SNUABM_44]QXO12301.1 hypothetical protein pEaSNUABM49_00055 [Erwinia phage pEa_SNUABM_49]AQW88580.1 hypothetical protein BF_0055 [Serratia phage BF]
MLDFKKHSVQEILDYAREQNRNTDTRSFVLGYDNECNVMLLSKWQDIGDCRAKVYPKGFSVQREQKYIFYYSKYNNFTTYSFENVSFSTKYNKKTKTEEIKTKMYKLSNKTVDIQTDSQTYTTTYEDLRIKERLFRNGCSTIDVDFPIVLYQNGVVSSRTFGGTHIYEKYNSKGVCTLCNFSFYYKGNHATVQMYYDKKKGATFWMNSGTGKTHLYVRDNIRIPEIKEAGIEYLFNDLNMWNIDLLMFGAENFECIEFAKKHLIQLLDKHKNRFGTALEKIRIQSEKKD